VDALPAMNLGSGLLSRRRLPVWRLDTELLCVLSVESLPPAELHGFGADDAAEWSPAEKMVQNIEANVPSGSTHRDKAAIDVVPQCEARAASGGFEFPAQVLAAPVVLEQLGSVGSRDCGFLDLGRGRTYRAELDRCSSGVEGPIRVEGRPLAQMCRVG
jgi:hypothetical protein